MRGTPIDAIKDLGVVRSPELASALQYAGSVRQLEREVEKLERSGAVISCTVSLPDGQQVKEYRLSTAAGGGLKLIQPTPGGREPDPVVERLKQWGTPPRPKESTPAPDLARQPRSAVTRQVPQAARPGRPAASAIKAPAAPAQVDRPDGRRLRKGVRLGPRPNTIAITQALQTHGPMTSRELGERGVKLEGKSTLGNACVNLALRGLLKQVGGSTKAKIWALPHQTLADRKPSSTYGVTPAGPIERGVPIPPRRYHTARHEYVAALAELRVTECRHLPVQLCDVASIARDAGLRGKYTVRTAAEGGVRVWRTKQ